MRHYAATAVLVALTAFSAPSRALDPLPVQLDEDTRLGFQLRFGFPQIDSGSVDALSIVHRFDALIPVGQHGAIALQWPLAYLSTSFDTGLGESESESHLVMGNFFVGYAFNPRPTLRFTPGLVLPLAQISSDEAGEDLVTYALAALTNARRDFWLYFPEAISLVAPLRSDLRLSDTVLLESDVAVALLFPNEGDDDIEIIADVEIAILISVVRLAIGGAVILTEDGDNASVSASAGVRVPVGRHQLWADLLVTLDEPAFFDDGAVPSVAVGFIARL